MPDDEKAPAGPWTGDICPDCGSAHMIRNGTCALCVDCGATTGCS